MVSPLSSSSSDLSPSSEEALKAAALKAKAWSFDEARRLARRLGNTLPKKGYVLFQTGYGPSGLPHIGTFGEVARTTMVRQAFETLTGFPTKLFCFSDDLDAFRKVPTNLPNQELLEASLGLPLSQVPDPFGEEESLGTYNNKRLQKFLDSFGFEYEFKSATQCYQSGLFDDALKRAFECYDELMAIMLPTLGAERQKTYSPFLPIDPETGKVLQASLIERKAESYSAVFQREDGTTFEVPVTGGHCKLQWKPDWAMRQFALDVDYEMSGKDLMESVTLAHKIIKVLGGRPPQAFTYELFLDDKGEKISKSKGNGLTMEEWLAYAPEESLAYFMYQKPRTAKRLHFDVIPKAVDEYLNFVRAYPDQELVKQLDNPAFQVHGAEVPKGEGSLSFALLLNLASVCNTEDKAVLWGFISRYDQSITPENAPFTDRLVGYAVRYYQDFIKPSKVYRAPTVQEKSALEALLERLELCPEGTDSEEIQSHVYAVGKEQGFENLRDWFKALYEILLGQTQGPRFGSFVALYGVEETKKLIKDALKTLN